jgi:hypothetical protein
MGGGRHPPGHHLVSSWGGDRTSGLQVPPPAAPSCQRFGALPDGVRQRVERIASLERLTALAERVLEVRSLEELDLG